MTVSELKELLEQYDDDAEVRLMTQPSWPFEWSISDVVSLSDLNGGPAAHQYVEGELLPEDVELGEEPVCGVCGETEEDGMHPDWTPEGAPSEVVYITEGTQLGYGTKDAWR